MFNHHPKLRIALIAISCLALITIISIVTMNVLSKTTGKDDSASQKTTAQYLAEAKKNQQDADSHKDRGETDQAIESYSKALENYKAAEDAGSASAIELELNYLKSISGPNAPNVSNLDMPSEDPADYTPEELKDD